MLMVILENEGGNKQLGTFSLTNKKHYRIAVIEHFVSLVLPDRPILYWTWNRYMG